MSRYILLLILFFPSKWTAKTSKLFLRSFLIKFFQVASKSHVNLEVQYKGRFLHSCSAVLILVGKRAGFQVGSTLVFRLAAAVDTITPLVNFSYLTLPLLILFC